jgi:dTDP-4-dehydrorhamnose reductase
MILVLGASGYVGQSFSSELRRRGWPFVPLTRRAIDYTSFNTLFDFVRKTRPEFIVNAAGCGAHRDVASVEGARWEALFANVVVPQNIARVCLMTKTPWGHVSSGSIFTGAKLTNGRGQKRIERDLNRPEIRRLFVRHPERIHGFVEGDEPNSSFHRPPCSFYSGTKALAEMAIQAIGSCYIWRPGLMFNQLIDGRNLLAKLQRGGGGVEDAIVSLSHLDDFVRTCLELWELRAPTGIYHVVNPGAVSLRRVAEMIREIHKPAREPAVSENGGNLSGGASGIARTHSVLDATKLLATGVRMPTVAEALASSLQKWQDPGPTLEYTRANTVTTSVWPGAAAFENLFTWSK